MISITASTLMQIMPAATSRAFVFAQPLWEAMQEFHIDTCLRASAFLGQVAVESGSLRYVRELWGPTPAQNRYEGSEALGNTMPGDGYRFRGRGLIQITGRANYARAGEALALDLIDQPELLEDPENAARSAAWFFADSGCCELADEQKFSQITKTINGGMNGYAERSAAYWRARDALGCVVVSS